MFKLVKRPEPSRQMVLVSPLLALLLTLLAGIILFLFMGVSPTEALYAFFVEPLTSLYGWAELGVKATPLVLIAVTLSVGFRAGIWNIGAEGQLTLGGICGGAVALLFYEVESVWVIPLMVLAGIAGGMFWAAIPAFLRTRFNANEILTSLMLTYVAGLLLSLLVHGVMRDPDGYNFPESRLFSDSALLPIILEGTRLHVGWLMALAVVVAAWIMMARTLIGFEVKVLGQAPAAGRYAGFSQRNIIWFSLLLSGGAAGLAGMIEVSGPIGQVLPTISPGYGFTAIIVAFVGRLHPVGVLLAGLLLALSYLGGESAQISLNLPLAVTGVFQGMLLFFLLACDVLIHYQIVRKTGPVSAIADQDTTQATTNTATESK
ncbi:ABC transporter permease [Leucothrix pacifica]|uniref:Sugar ABC transporter permease n=1 Tax=Leucothrix pacifica TaxID=1247513 RepID=A0A317CQ94_9GAMM|nr:ABC transporter permease [Leucothrix pacifica]PWR00687.1 sugar ABC transporter permease [Leucothrix pacifica]